MKSCSKADPEPSGNPSPEISLTLDPTNASYAALNTVGGFVVAQGIIVAKTASGYIALDSTCTHQGCTVGYSSVNNNFPCPCHGSVYSATGSVVNGPATIALTMHPISKSGNSLVITL